jgi:3-phosphoshikimate 1-carboxyvinyltransferase
MMRAVFLSLLTNEPSTIVNLAWSSEAVRQFEAAKRFGLSVGREQADRVIVTGVGRSLRPVDEAITVGGSAFNFRTLAGLACLSPHWTTLEGNSSMRSRPVVEHLTFIKDLGGELEDVSDSTNLRVRIRGGRHVGGETTVDTRHSSQVLTAALLIAPVADGTVTIHHDDADAVGEGYVELTVDMMRQQGASIEQTGSSYVVQPSVYQSRIHHVTSDFTALSYLAGAVAVAGGKISVPDFYPSAFSSEREFMEVLDRLGVRNEYDPLDRVLHLGLTSPDNDVIEIDGRNIPTVVPTLAGMAPFVDAKIQVRNVAHVNNHKCRRVEVMIAELRKMGCAINPLYNRDGILDGFSTAGRQSPPGGVTLSSHGDHRILMSLATAALGARMPTVIDGVEHLTASFPDYFTAMTRLGVQSEAHLTLAAEASA